MSVDNKHQAQTDIVDNDPCEEQSRSFGPDMSKEEGTLWREKKVGNLSKGPEMVKIPELPSQRSVRALNACIVR